MTPQEGLRPTSKLGLALTIGSAVVETVAGTVLTLGAFKILNENLPYLAQNYFSTGLYATDVYVLNLLAASPTAATFLHGAQRIANYADRMRKPT